VRVSFPRILDAVCRLVAQHLAQLGKQAGVSLVSADFIPAQRRALAGQRSHISHVAGWAKTRP
jgi:hypothetical protein